MVREGNRTESDHLPLEVKIEEPKIQGSDRKQWMKVIERSDWTKEGMKMTPWRVGKRE